MRILILSLLCLPSLAVASPYCVTVTGLPSECIYADAAECSNRASQLGGICDVNPKEIILPGGGARYCLVGESGAVQCLYSDRNSCNSAANSIRGTCVENRPASTQPNPFAAEPNRAY